MGEVVIREFDKTEEDIEALYRLHFQLTDKRMEYGLFKERLLNIITDRKQVNFLAQIDDKIVGYVAVQLNFDFDGKHASIAGLVVDKDYKRQGIGKELMKRAETWAKENDALHVKLRSSMARANEAHIFYQNIGYNKTKEQACFEKKI